MKPRMDSEQPTRRASDVDGVSSRAGQEGAAPVVSGDEERVFECLRSAGTGLTLRQVEARTREWVTDPKVSLASLVECGLVARLNTLIPTYMVRNRDEKADAR